MSASDKDLPVPNILDPTSGVLPFGVPDGEWETEN